MTRKERKKKQKVGDNLLVFVVNLKIVKNLKSQDHKIKGSCDFTRLRVMFLGVCHHPDKFVENKGCES